MKTKKTPPPPAKFDCSKQDAKLIVKIAQRAVALAQETGVDYKFPDAEMDITAVHCNGCPLDLQKFLDAPSGDFGHDAFGIRRYIDRQTGKLTECFDPRCSQPASARR